MADIDRSKEQKPQPSGPAPTGLRAIVIGGTGEIGRHLVTELLSSGSFAKVTTINRRKVADDFWPKNDKLNEVVFPLDDLKKDENNKHFEGHDVAFCALGTTRGDAGSDSAFIKVDFDYVTQFAEQAKGAGARDFHLVSSVGADKSSWFLYMRTKGLAEDFVSKLGFSNTFIYRPPLLGRSEPRFAEKFLGIFTKAMPVAHVGQCMRDIAVHAFSAPAPQGQNVRIFESKELWKMKP